MTPRKGLVLVVACSASIAGIGFVGGYGAPKSSPTGSFSKYRAGPNFADLTFTYPASWQASTYSFVSTFSSSIVYLSNQEMHPPCKGGSCALPVTSLQPGGILAWWSANGAPTWTFDAAAGDPITVAGRRAKLSIVSGNPGWSYSGSCGPIGADWAVRAVVERPEIRDNWYELDACIRGPDVAILESQVRALLASTTLAALPSG